jgi:hypothetical protein
MGERVRAAEFGCADTVQDGHEIPFISFNGGRRCVKDRLHHLHDFQQLGN